MGQQCMKSENQEVQTNTSAFLGQLFPPRGGLGPVGALIIVNQIKNECSRDQFEEKSIKIGEVNLEEVKSNKDEVLIESVFKRIKPAVSNQKIIWNDDAEEQKEDAIKQIKDLFNKEEQKSSILYLSGNMDSTGAFMVGKAITSSKLDLKIQFKEIYDLWRLRKSQQEFCLLILDCNFSGTWIEQFRALRLDHTMAIFASCDAAQHSFQSVNGGIFTRNMAVTLSGEKDNNSLLCTVQEKQQSQTAQFYGMVYKVYNYTGLPMFFTTNQDRLQYMQESFEVYREGDANEMKKKNQKNNQQEYTRYEGEFKKGKREGRGIEHVSAKERYEGEWSANQRSGLGSEYQPDGGRYDGIWKDGKKDGQGVQYYFYKAGPESFIQTWTAGTKTSSE